MTTLTIAPDHTSLTINGQRFHAFWLRDNALDSASRSSGNGQRLFTLTDDILNARIDRAEVSGRQLQVVLSGHECFFPLEWLAANAYDRSKPTKKAWLGEGKQVWDGSHQRQLTSGDFGELQADEKALKAWLAGFCRDGVAKISGGPVREGALFDVVDLMGAYVRETNYGRLFEVRTEVNPTNLAYTGLGLQSHADNPYRDPVPTIQVLFCLESSAAGGENMVVDGFKAAQRLRDEDPDGFEALTQFCGRWEFSGDAQTCLRSRKPMIELAPDGEIISVRFNNRSAAPITDVPFDVMETYYRGYRKLAEIIDDPAMEMLFRLDPGECFIVDNTRVMHARKGYSGAGTRWLQGCYADKDAVYSKLAAMNGEGWNQ